jgi:hypothetical protein
MFLLSRDSEKNCPLKSIDPQPAIGIGDCFVPGMV